MSKPRPPDRFERAVAKYFTKELGDPTDVFVSEAKTLAVTLLRREHAAVRRLVKEFQDGTTYSGKKAAVKLLYIGHNTVCRDILAALDKRRSGKSGR